MANHLESWWKVDLLPHVGLSLVNEGSIPHDIICKRTGQVIEPCMLPKVGLNFLVLLFSGPVFLQVSYYLYGVLPVIYSEVVL